MDFSKLSQEKDKLFIILAAVFLFLFMFLAFDSVLKMHILVYMIWLIFFFPIMVFSGVIYGFFTKSRIRSVILGISFPLIFYISKAIFDSYYTMTVDYSNSTHFFSSTSFLTFGAYPAFIILNAVACWFASTSEEDKSERKLHYYISLICMALVVFFMASLFYSIIVFIF